MAYQNCWEFKKCGREKGGAKISELGICPASTEARLHRINHGKNGGRACWVVAGTFCKGEIQGVFTSDIAICLVCDFYTLVAKEEGPRLKGTKELLVKLE